MLSDGSCRPINYGALIVNFFSKWATIYCSLDDWLTLQSQSNFHFHSFLISEHSKYGVCFVSEFKWKYYNNKLHVNTNINNRPFVANDHVVQNPPCWRAISLLFPHWDIKTKASQASLVQVSLF